MRPAGSILKGCIWACSSAPVSVRAAVQPEPLGTPDYARRPSEHRASHRPLLCEHIIGSALLLLPSGFNSHSHRLAAV